MKKETVDALLSLLGYVIGVCSDLDQKVAAAEKVFGRHSEEVYLEYQKDLANLRRLGNQTRIVLSFEDLRAKLLRDQ